MQSTPKVLALLVILFGVSSIGAAATTVVAPQKVPVYVTSDSREGFTDPSKSRQDSVKDMIKRIINSKVLKSARTEEEALIVLRVLGRDTKREANFFGYQNKSSVFVELSVGSYTTEFEGISGSKGMFKGYGDAAGKVIKQVEEWVEANRAQLDKQKAEKAATSTEPQTAPAETQTQTQTAPTEGHE